jgi:hypothetical protein
MAWAAVFFLPEVYFLDSSCLIRRFSVNIQDKTGRIDRAEIWLKPCSLKV